MTPHVVVVGGGITGLAAAWELASAGAPVTLLEGSGRLGGKILTGTVAGVDVDLAADAFLARRPEAVALCEELGLREALVAPAVQRALIWSRGRLVPLPDGLVLGVPSRAAPLLRSPALSWPGRLRAVMDLVLPGAPEPDDVAVGAYVRSRFGREVDERLVDPLLGGINAGRTDRLSARVAAPQLAQVIATAKGSAMRSLRRLVPAPAAAPVPVPAPVFFTLPGGLSRLVDALETALRARGVDVHVDAPVERVETPNGRGRVRSAAGVVDADAAVLTVPAGEAWEMVAGVAPRAARGLAEIAYASVALVTVAVRRVDVDHPLDASGFLVPRPEGRLLTACTWASSKWAHLAHPELALLRLSAGRVDDERFAALDDATLVAKLLDDVRPMIGLRGDPVDVRVARWPRSFPQFAPGHLARVEQIERALAEEAPMLRAAGAWSRGVGIPACIASGRGAARSLLR